MSKTAITLSFLFIIHYVSCLYFHIGETEKKCFIEEIPDETMVVGVYKVEIFDKVQNQYVPTVSGLGMHVEVRDPDDDMVMSRKEEEDLHSDTLSLPGKHCTSNYVVEIFDPEIKKFLATPISMGMKVEVTDPAGTLMMERTYAAEGRFTFTSHSAGEHVICLHSNSSSWFGGGQLRVHLDIEIGEHANDYKEIAQKDKLTELQLRVRQLLDQVEQITKEQNYQRRVHFKLNVGEDTQDYKRVQEKERLTELQVEVRKLIDKATKIKKEQDYQRYREERFRQTSESTNQRVLWWSIAQTFILLITGFWQMRHLKGFFEAKKLV